ncbi:MAG: hypothetical protein K0R54_728 [Clostridiaceae bacterium]|jgi:hypothetical protein|nr:hypothetical protein [Clostridiaceae bacterium]
MGMYDYLGGEQVKIFYSPIFDKDFFGEIVTVHSGGSLLSFGTNDRLPLKTLYYKYPENFCVFDYRGNKDVFIIKDGKFKEIKKYYKLKKADIGDSVVNYYGTEISINNLGDFKRISNDFNNTFKKYENGKKELLPKGFNETLKNYREEFKSKESELNELTEKTFGVFNKKWVADDKYMNEKDFGELLLCYIKFEVASEDSDKHYSKEDHMACKKALLDFMSEHKNIEYSYVKWLDDDKLISLDYMNNVILKALSL